MCAFPLRFSIKKYLACLCRLSQPTGGSPASVLRPCGLREEGLGKPGIRLRGAHEASRLTRSRSPFRTSRVRMTSIGPSVAEQRKEIEAVAASSRNRPRLGEFATIR